MITLLKDEEFGTALMNAIQGADKEILITTYKMGYRQLSSTRRVNAIVEGLGGAVKRSVKVCCILNMDNEKGLLGRINNLAAQLLREKGIRIKTGTPGRTFHAKLIIIDGAIAFVGSHNLSESSLCRNFEISLMITPDAYGWQGLEGMLGTIHKLRKIFLKEWKKLK